MREGLTTVSCEGEAIGPAALLDPALLLATPVTAIRYPLAAIVKNPNRDASLLFDVSLERIKR